MDESEPEGMGYRDEKVMLDLEVLERRKIAVTRARKKGFWEAVKRVDGAGVQEAVGDEELGEAEFLVPMEG